MQRQIQTLKKKRVMLNSPPTTRNGRKRRQLESVRPDAKSKKTDNARNSLLPEDIRACVECSKNSMFIIFFYSLLNSI